MLTKILYYAVVLTCLKDSPICDTKVISNAVSLEDCVIVLEGRRKKKIIQNFIAHQTWSIKMECLKNIYINVQGVTGADIAYVLNDMIILSSRMGVKIQTDFNGILLNVSATDNLETLIKNFNYALEHSISIVNINYPCPNFKPLPIPKTVM